MKALDLFRVSILTGTGSIVIRVLLFLNVNHTHLYSVH